MQGLALAVAILRDRRDEPVFPRWVGYFNIWIVLVLVPGGLIVFSHDGPVAWDGVFTGWLEVAAFGVWLAVMFLSLHRAVDQQEREESPVLVDTA